jgi:hypothetical protein
MRWRERMTKTDSAINDIRRELLALCSIREPGVVCVSLVLKTGCLPEVVVEGSSYDMDTKTEKPFTKRVIIDSDQLL